MRQRQVVIHASATSPEIDTLPEDTVALISLGATEQHGPHLPLSMDTVLAEALATRVAAMLNAPVLIYPTVPFGLSDHHRDFAGTITVSESILHGIVDAYVDSALRSGISRVAILSGHGGNYAFLKTYRDHARARRPGLRVAAFAQLGEMIDACAVAAEQAGLAWPACDAHAGLVETSVALHLLRAGEVGDFGDVHGYLAAEPGWIDRLLHEGVAGLSPIGVIGDPRNASAAAGARFLEAIALQIARHFAIELSLNLRTVEDSLHRERNQMTDAQELSDRIAIADVLAGLAYAQDDKDWSALRLLFADVIRIDVSEHLGGEARDLPVDELVAMCRAVLDGFAMTHHATSNVRTTIDGDVAVSRAHMIAYHHLPTDPGIADFCTMRGYWKVSLVRTNERWLINGWKIVRSGPLEGYPGLYQLAAGAAAAKHG